VKKQKPVECVSYAVDGVLIETVFQLGNLKYAICNGNGQPKIADTYKIETGQIAPPDSTLVRRGVILLPSEIGESKTTDEMIKDIRGFFHKYVECPEFWEELIAYYVLMTWVYDRFTALPYFRALGEWSSGKTRAIQIAGQLCYKALMVSGATTLSPIFRLTDRYKGTLIVDEGDFQESAMWSEFTKFLNCGYTKGIPLLRSERVGNSFEPTSFDGFCPKLLATRGRFEDEALESRCLTYEPVKLTKLRDDIPRQLPLSFGVEAQRIRNDLLAWRFEHWSKIEADENELRSLPSRVTQVSASLWPILTPEFKVKLKAYLLRQSGVNAAHSIPRLFAEVLDNVKDQRTRVADIAERVNELAGDQHDERRVSPRQAGTTLRSLGFEIRYSRGVAWVTPETARVQEIIQEHLYEDIGVGETSIPG
jgi:hypothetical protein